MRGKSSPWASDLPRCAAQLADVPADLCQYWDLVVETAAGCRCYSLSQRWAAVVAKGSRVGHHSVVRFVETGIRKVEEQLDALWYWLLMTLLPLILHLVGK